MIEGPHDGRLLEGVELFNNGRFFEAHDSWELVWKRMESPFRDAVQGLIQLAAACHHLQKGNSDGARTLLTKGEKLLSSFGNRPFGIDSRSLIKQVEAHIESNRTSRRPTIRIL